MPKRDLTDPSYLDRLGYESAYAGADAVRRRIAREGGNVALPLSDADVNHLLDTTVEELHDDEEARLAPHEHRQAPRLRQRLVRDHAKTGDRRLKKQTMIYRDPYEPSTQFDYEPGGSALLAHIDTKSRFEKDNLGYSTFRALVSVISDPSTIKKWKMTASSIPDQDADRRTLREALAQQSQLLTSLSNHSPGTYIISGNWHLLPRRGYQRLEFWM